MARHRFRAERVDNGVRLDKFLVVRFPGYSRSLLQKIVKEGHVKVNGRTTRPGRTVNEGDRIDVRLPVLTRPYARPENIPLDVLHEDDALAVINKPAGLTVHPGSGQREGTLANALAYRFGELSSVQGQLRPGIVHRLDKDTTGVLLIAKTDLHHHYLARQFRERSLTKEYLAVAHGVVELDSDLISLPIGPDRYRTLRMAVRHDIGRTSDTFYEVLERFPRHSYVRVRPKTGRTHQIRVHLSALGHPIVADALYGGKSGGLEAIVDRQMLHAHRLTFRHPLSGEEVTFRAPIPEDMERLLEHLRSLNDGDL
ncbi:MAG: RluA family pseudouridine synthase [Planctomycetota bacterium]